METHRNTSAVTYRTVPCRFGSVLASAQGASRGEITVGVGHHRPDRIEHLVQLLRLHVFARDADHGVGGGQDGLVGRGELARRRQHAAERLSHHRQRALRQIAEIVGEIGIDAVDDRLVIVIAVLAERHFAQKEIAQRIDAIGIRQRSGSITLPTDFDIFSPRLNKKPW